MRSVADPSRGATVMLWQSNEVRGHAGMKSGITSEEKDMEERSRNRLINMVDISLRMKIYPILFDYQYSTVRQNGNHWDIL